MTGVRLAKWPGGLWPNDQRSIGQMTGAPRALRERQLERIACRVPISIGAPPSPIRSLAAVILVECRRRSTRPGPTDQAPGVRNLRRSHVGKDRPPRPRQGSDGLAVRGSRQRAVPHLTQRPGLRAHAGSPVEGPRLHDQAALPCAQRSPRSQPLLTAGKAAPARLLRLARPSPRGRGALPPGRPPRHGDPPAPSPPRERLRQATEHPHHAPLVHRPPLDDIPWPPDSKPSQSQWTGGVERSGGIAAN
jgi:hypothetical protein